MVDPQKTGGIMNVETGVVYPDWGSVPVGAMWHAPWMKVGSIHWDALPACVRELGQLIVKTPEGDWNIDVKSSNGSGWGRTGIPPVVTARPSIGKPWPEMKFHAYLTDGVLEELPI